MYENCKEDIISAQCGDKDAMAKLVKENNGLIWSIVKRFGNRGYEIEDLYQIGCIGFIKSIKRFDTNFDVKLSTYAVPYILGEIKRFIRDDGPIKVSRSIKELVVKIYEIQKEYMRKTGKEISINMISKELKIPKEEIAMALDSVRPVESIYENQNDDDTYIIDKIKGEKDETELLVNKMTLKDIIKGLKKEEREIILLRYYKEKTQMQVAKILGISQVQVSRIEKKILGNMKNKLAGNNV